MVHCPKASASSAHGGREEQGSQLVTVFCSIFCWSHLYCYPGLCLHRCFFLILDLNSKFAISFASSSVCYCGTWPIVNMSNKQRGCYEFLFLFRSSGQQPASLIPVHTQIQRLTQQTEWNLQGSRSFVVILQVSPAHSQGLLPSPPFCPAHGEQTSLRTDLALPGFSA